MAFTLETLEDFDQTLFDRGAGWAIVFEIHNAILARAQATGHPLRSTIATQFSGLLWLEEGYDPSRPELRSKLATMYNWIGQLLSSSSGIRWTEASGRSAEWTITTLTADIGMGDFDDLLVKPQRPEPLVWLVAALNRLRHPKLLRDLQMQELIVVPDTPVNYVYREAETDEAESNSSSDLHYAWANMSYDPAFAWYYRKTVSGSGGGSPLNSALRWQTKFFGFGNGAIANNKFKHISLVSKRQDGTFLIPTTTRLHVNCLDYNVGLVCYGYIGPEWVVKIGSSADINIGKLMVPIPAIESTIDDLDFEGEKTITAELMTPTGSYPFNDSFGNNYISMSLKTAWIYCDLPDVLGIGELDAPLPTVAGEATAEEE